MTDDPVARVIESLTEIQRRSLAAADAVVDRLVAAVDGSHEPAPVETPDHATDEGGPEAQSGYDDLLDSWARLWRESITGMAASLPRPSDGRVRVDVDGPSPTSPVVVHLDQHGNGTFEVWVHNSTAEPAGKLRVHSGRPQSHDGHSIDDLALTCEPDAFDLPARASRGVAVTVEAPDTPPGTYRTILLVEGLPDQWLPLEIHVPRRDR